MFSYDCPIISIFAFHAHEVLSFTATSFFPTFSNLIANRYHVLCELAMKWCKKKIAAVIRQSQRLFILIFFEFISSTSIEMIIFLLGSYVA